MRSRWLAVSVAILSCVLTGPVRGEVPAEPAKPLVKTGDTIVFLGDSITAQGFSQPTGYVKLVAAGLEQAGIKVTAIGAGVSGNKSNQMLERLDKDVIAKKPTWMTLSCGVNDVWHGEGGVKLEDYKTNITAIVDKAQAAGIKVMILTATMIQEDPNNAFNKKLADYNDFLRALAKEKGCPLADLNAAMQEMLKDPGAADAKGRYLTVDGVHMNPRGNQMMAAPILKAFGVPDEQLKKITDGWASLPQPFTLKTTLTQKQLDRLAQLAASRKQTVQELLDSEMGKTIEKLLAETGKPGGE